MSGSVTAADVVEACHYLAEAGLGTSTSGNVSGRDGERVWLTATGTRLGEAAEDNLSLMSLDGRRLNEARPTKEARFHLSIYRSRPAVNAVVHAHPSRTVALSTLVEPGAGAHVPAVTPQFVMRAGRVPVLPYNAPGTDELADAVAECEAARAMVLANHGAIAFAESFSAALGVLEELEENCGIYLLAGGRGRVLEEDEVEALLSRSM